MKKIFYALITLIVWIVFWLILWFHHNTVFDNKWIELFWYKINYEKDVFSSYKKYFIKKDEDPIYVWNDSVFEEFALDCHEKDKNCLIFPNQQFYTDLIWISSIQFVWWATEIWRSQNLYRILDNLTNLSYYWKYPYIFWQIMIPHLKKAEDATLLQKQQSRNESVFLWEKAMKFLCDMNKVNKIKSLNVPEFYSTLNNLLEKQKYINPCETYEIPNYLWFNYYYFIWDPENSSNNYKVASFSHNSPKAVPWMVAVVSGRLWKYLTSSQIWFTRFYSDLEKLKSWVSSKEAELLENDIKDSLKKSVFEFQLYILDQASWMYTWDSKTCFHDYNCLLKEWLIEKTIDNITKTCSNSKNINLDNLFDIDASYDELIDNINCILIWEWIKQWYISEDGNMIPTIKKQNNMEFYWDDEENTRWVWDFLK